MTEGIKVLFIGKSWPVPYQTLNPDKLNNLSLNYDKLNNLFSTIAQFKPDVIVTSEDAPRSLNVAQFSLRKRWIHINPECALSEVIHAIEACYAGTIWENHPYQDQHPLISVYTGTYNTGDYLRDTYQSLREQTYPNWEWVIVDDESTDETWERLLQIASEDVRVRPIKIPHSGKIGEVKRTASQLALGRYLVELDHDDMLMDNALDEIKQAFEQNPEVGMVYSNFTEFYLDGSGHKYGGEFWEKRYRQTEYRGKVYDECLSPDIYDSFGPDFTDLFAWYLTVGPNHVRAFRTSEFHRLGGYNPNLPVADDWDLTARFFLHSKIFHIDKMLYLYRFLDGSGNTTFKRNKSIQDHLELARNHYRQSFETYKRNI